MIKLFLMKFTVYYLNKDDTRKNNLDEVAVLLIDKWIRPCVKDRRSG